MIKLHSLRPAGILLLSQDFHTVVSQDFHIENFLPDLYGSRRLAIRVARA